MSTPNIRAPFPYAGGKSRIAATVWRALGPDVPNYVEVAFGSGAVLLSRPNGAGKIETVNDLDGFLTNFWRAIQSAPEEVARHCDWPVSELDLHSRHRWLVNQTEFLDRMRAEPEFFDAKIAGWWVWGICQWIGGGWCSAPRSSAKVPILDGIGKGVHANQGFSEQLPSLNANVGLGVNHGRLLGLPALGNDRGLNGVAAAPCIEWFRALSERLRRVRIACGDFERVLGPSVLGKGKNVGGRRPCAVFIDPTYAHDLRAGGLYREDSPGFSRRAREWAIAHGDDRDLRIALCGYFDEHGPHMPSTWTAHRWRGVRGYAGADNNNRDQETIWFSPHCLAIDSQRELFAETHA